MSIRTMTPEDLELVLLWAADEGWNPGLEDAQAFLAADPDGFLIKTVDGKPAAALSVVNHDAHNAFLGLYICVPELRGRGLGFELWNAGIAHAGSRCIGLDGVPEQVANYQKSGFTPAGMTTRFTGTSPVSPKPLVATPVSIDELLREDAKMAGFERDQFGRSWFTDTQSRQTFVLSDTCFATARQCQVGVKIGPLYAQTSTEVDTLLAAIAARYPNQTLILDVPDTSHELQRYLRRANFQPAFETLRMYRGTAPQAELPAFSATATLELG